MNYLLYIIFSAFESFSIVLLGLILFRFRFDFKISSDLFRKCMAIGLTLSVISLILNVFSLESVSPFVQIIVMFVLIKFLFRIKVLHAFLVTIVPYFIFALSQGIFILITNYFNVIKFSEVVPFTFKGYLVQFVGFILVIIIATHIKSTNEGYAFVPEESRIVAKFSNKILFLISASSVIIISGLFFEYKRLMYFNYFTGLLATIIILVIVLIYVHLMRDKEEAR